MLEQKVKPKPRGVVLAIAGLAVIALVSSAAAQISHFHSPNACLGQKERRAEIESGRIVRLGAAMKTATSRMPGTVVRARLCRSHNGLVYVLTVLARDGKVARLTVDAVRGTLISGR